MRLNMNVRYIASSRLISTIDWTRTGTIRQEFAGNLVEVAWSTGAVEVVSINNLDVA